MFEQDISMDLLMQYGLQATSAVIILAAGMLLAKWVGQYIHQTLEKFEMEPPVSAAVDSSRAGDDHSADPSGGPPTIWHSNFSPYRRAWYCRCGNWIGLARGIHEFVCVS